MWIVPDSTVPSQVTRIELRVQTGNKTDGGTDGDVFLGVAGREFFVDTSSNDFERSSNRTYVFGDGATVVRPTQNDPRSPWQLTFDDLRRAPRYLRFEPGSDWNVGRIDLTVSYTGGSLSVCRLSRGMRICGSVKTGQVLVPGLSESSACEAHTLRLRGPARAARAIANARTGGGATRRRRCRLCFDAFSAATCRSAPRRAVADRPKRARCSGFSRRGIRPRVGIGSEMRGLGRGYVVAAPLESSSADGL
jgi:hypothetical protein